MLTQILRFTQNDMVQPILFGNVHYWLTLPPKADQYMEEIVLQEIESYTSIVNRWIEAFNTHNVSAIVSLYTDDAELFDTGMKRVRHGRGEIEQWFTTRFQSMPTIAYAPSGKLFSENRAAVTWRASGRTPRLLGLPFFARLFQVDGVSVFTFRDDLIQQQRGYYDHLSVMERVLPPLKLLPGRL